MQRQGRMACPVGKLTHGAVYGCRSDAASGQDGVRIRPAPVQRPMSASEDAGGEGHERSRLSESRLQVLARDVEQTVVSLILETE